MRVLLLQLDGKLPNLALMRIAHHHEERGHYVELRRAGNRAALEPRFEDRIWGGDRDTGMDPPPHPRRQDWDKVYGSLIFKSTLPLAERAMEIYPHIELGGTGWSLEYDLSHVGIDPEGPYSLGYRHYPKFSARIGYTQRGCRLSCDFCVVPTKEGKVKPAFTIAQIADTKESPSVTWTRGSPGDQIRITQHEVVRWILLLDNDFFGNPQWPERIDELRNGTSCEQCQGGHRYRVSFNQGINARALNKETAQAIASVDYRDDSFKTKRIYTAWDNIGHEKPLFRGLEALAAAGVKPDHIMVYMLIGFGDSAQDRETRRRKLREFGCRPYPMPYVRTPELVGFQRWVIGAYDKRIAWEDWHQAKYEPRKLNGGKYSRISLPLFPEEEP